MQGIPDESESCCHLFLLPVGEVMAVEGSQAVQHAPVLL